MIMNIDKSWHSVLGYLNVNPLSDFLGILPAYKYNPDNSNIFKVFEKPLSSIKVVILGQNPYMGCSYFTGQCAATGRAFGVPENHIVTTSLITIQNELLEEYPLAHKDFTDRKWRTLEHLDDQGVFLLNTALTVERYTDVSHAKYWNDFIVATIKFIAQSQPCVWLLWGTKANRYVRYLRNPIYSDQYDLDTIKDIPASPEYNHILSSAHPAIKDSSFIGNNHFIKTNHILAAKGLKPIQW